MRLADKVCSIVHGTVGSVTVEAVAMTPVVLVALVFSFEFGKALWAYDVMTRDVRAAARFLSRDGVAEPTRATRAQNVAETGSAAGGQKNFPWTLGTATFTIAPVAKTGTYGATPTVYQIRASLPITLSFLEAIDNFRNSDDISPNYTLVVSDEIRHIGE